MDLGLFSSLTVPGPDPPMGKLPPLGSDRTQPDEQQDDPSISKRWTMQPQSLPGGSSSQVPGWSDVVTAASLSPGRTAAPVGVPISRSGGSAC